MKINVDEMPEKEEKCPFSEWHPYPPIIEKTGDWYCKMDNRICNLGKDRCRWMEQK